MIRVILAENPIRLSYDLFFSQTKTRLHHIVLNLLPRELIVAISVHALELLIYEAPVDVILLLHLPDVLEGESSISISVMMVERFHQVFVRNPRVTVCKSDELIWRHNSISRRHVFVPEPQLLFVVSHVQPVLIAADLAISIVVA